MKWIINCEVVNDEGEWVEINEEYTTQWEFNQRYADLKMNYDEPIWWKLVKD